MVDPSPAALLTAMAAEWRASAVAHDAQASAAQRGADAVRAHQTLHAHRLSAVACHQASAADCRLRADACEAGAGALANSEP